MKNNDCWLLMTDSDGQQMIRDHDKWEIITDKWEIITDERSWLRTHNDEWRVMTDDDRLQTKTNDK